MFKILLVVGLLITVTAATDDSFTVIPPPQPPQPTAAPSNTTTTTAKPTSTTTTNPTSTSTTTTRPTSTSTTTTNPTSTSTTTTSTTKKPITTTSPPTPITTPAPKPDNKPGLWNVTEENKKGVACIVATMYVKLMVPYVKVDAKNTSLVSNATAVIYVPSSAQASGSCGNDTQTLVLSWKLANVPLSLAFDFAKNSSTSQFLLSHVKANLPANDTVFPGIENTTDFELATLNASSSIPLHQSYLCAAGLNFTLADAGHKNATGVPTLLLTQVQFQAFADAKDNKFASAVDCAPYVTPDIVPIAVGVSLAALVAVVLVAYVIGRRRTAGRGYVAM